MYIYIYIYIYIMYISLKNKNIIEINYVNVVEFKDNVKCIIK